MLPVFEFVAIILYWAGHSLNHTIQKGVVCKKLQECNSADRSLPTWRLLETFIDIGHSKNKEIIHKIHKDENVNKYE